MTRKSVDIIVPCYNEEPNINIFYNTVCKIVADEKDYLVRYIFVDDGSNDRTLHKIKELSENDSSVKYISFSRNFGKEAAMYAGLKNSTGDYVTIMDADLQDDPSLLVQMFRAMEEGYDCCGVRRTNRKGEAFLRSKFSELFYKLMKKYCDVQIVDGARDFRLMTRQMVNAILLLEEKERFSKGIFNWVGFRYKWLECDNIIRKNGTSKWSMLKLMKYACCGLMSFSNMPLHFLMASGAGIAFISLCFMIVKILKVVFFGIDVHGYASTIVLICFFGGLQLCATGLVGEYLARVNSEVKGRPIYIVREENLEEREEEE